MMEPRPDRTASTTDREEQLGEAVEQYLSLAEQGPAPDPEEFAAGFPGLEADLAAALEGLALVQGLVGASADGGRHRLRAGHRVAGYRIVRELGRGGMGIVYEAVHVDLDRPVALKVLGAPASPGSRGRQRFLNEAKTAAGLHHTHIVPVFDVGQVGGLCYYAMQRIEGCGLDRVLRLLRRERTTGAGSASSKRGTSASPTLVDEIDGESAGSALWASGSLGTAHGGGGDATGSWPPHRPAAQRHEPPAFTPPLGAEYYRWVARAGQQAADALAYAHRRGVIHRDVKPSNLLVDAKGTVWVADFGLARRMADPGLTRGDAVVGTPRYMSPEQAEGQAVDGRTDVYSLGTTLYELLTLRPPFEGQSAPELIRQITGREAPSPRQFDRRVPKDLETIVLKAMAKRPSDRYATASEMAEDLGRFLATEPVKARRISPAGRFWRFTRRHPATTAVTAVATAVVLTVAAIAYQRVADERDRALAFQGRLANALEKQQAAATEADRAHAKELLSGAERERQAARPNMREAGFGLLARSAKLDPAPDRLADLRDEALRFVALRDVVPREAVLQTGRMRGLAVKETAAGPGLAVLAEDGRSVTIWDPETGTAGPPLRLEPPEPEPAGGTGPGESPGRGGGRRGGRDPFPQIAVVGQSLTIVPREGRGLLWLDPATGRVARAELPGDPIRGVMASGDGRRLVTVSEPEAVPSRRGEPAREDGRLVQIWDTADLSRPLATLEPEPWDGDQQPPPDIPRLAMDPDGTRLAVGWLMRPQVGIWELDTGRRAASVDTRLSVMTVALGPEGLLATAGDGQVQLWEVMDESARPLPGLADQHGPVRGMRFSPDGSLLATVGWNTGVSLWHPASKTLVASVPTPEGVVDLAFHGQQTLFVASGSQTQAWEIVEPQGRSRFPLESTAWPAGLVFTQDGRLVVPTRGGDPSVWSAGNCPTRQNTWPEVRDAMIAAGPSGWLAVLARDGLVWYDSPYGDPIAMQPWAANASGEAPARPPSGSAERPPAEPPYLLASSPDGHQLAILRLVDRPGRGPGRPDSAEAENRRREDGPRDGRGPGGGPPPGGSPPPDGGPPPDRRPGDGPAPKAEGSRGGPGRADSFRGPRAEVLLWSAGAGPGSAPPAPRRMALPTNADARLLPLLWSKLYHGALIDPSGRWLIFLADEGVRRWRLEGDRLIDDPFPTDPGRGTCLAIRADGRVLAIGRRTGETSLVDAQTGAPIASLARSAAGGAQAPPDGEARPTSMAFTPAGDLLAIGAPQGDLSVWSVAGDSPRRLFDLPGHRGQISHLAFDPTGRRLAAADMRFAEERTVEVWDLETIRNTLEPIGLGW
jgi:serine/threonine protein kinase/WD40 repeat protein